MEEIVRVSRDGARLVVIDYDWSTADGPPPLVAWKSDLLDLLTTFGFDPDYGQRLTVELGRHLSAAGLSTRASAVTELRAPGSTTLRAALPTLDALVEPVISHLRAVGLPDRANRLRRHSAVVAELAEQHPELSVAYPALVATVVDMTRQRTQTAETPLGRRRPERHAKITRDLAPAGPPGLEVFRLESTQLVDQARRLQAAEYARHRYHTVSSTDADGYLIADIDPPEVVVRSSYLGMLTADGEVGACIRMIGAAEGDLRTLPTLAKISKHARPDEDPLATLPFPHGSVVFEVSALAKSSSCPDPTVTTRLLLAVVSEALRRGDDFAVMGLVEPIASLLLTAYGRRAIRPLDLPRAHVSGTGVRPAGLTLVPCYTEAVTFVSDILAHCRKRPDDRFSRLTTPLCELTAASSPTKRDAGKDDLCPGRRVGAGGYGAAPG